MLEHVASQTKRLPLSMEPSGRFPSEWSRLMGSSLDGMWEVDRARWNMNMSFNFYVKNNFSE